jgi:hypothetical protein
MPAQPQVIPGALKTGAVATALLGPSPDGTCRAVFAVITADGAIVQEYTEKGLDGLAHAGTVRPILGRSWDSPHGGNCASVRSGHGSLHTDSGGATALCQRAVPQHNRRRRARDDRNFPNQVFGLGSLRRIRSLTFNLPVDLAPAAIDTENVNWATNTTLDDGSDFYVTNRGDNTIVRVKQDGTVVAIPRVAVKPHPLDDAELDGIATASDGSKIYVTFTRPGRTADQGGVLELPAFP